LGIAPLTDVGLWVLVGLVVGWLAALTDRSTDEGVLADVAVGVVGACVGGVLTWLLPVWPRSHLILSIAAAMIGASALLAVVRAITTARWSR
jgi:uncharacterized membrane protein YeaQ/YmgE (transglycosylase-associated protein family)